MIGMLILAIIFILTIVVCRNNLKNRIEELKTNLQKFNSQIEERFVNMPENKQQEFLNSLEPHLSSNLQSILNNSFNYANNHWAIQQQIAEQQELFNKLHKFSR